MDNIIIRNRSQAIEYLVGNALKESRIAVILAGESISALGKVESRYAFKVSHETIIEEQLRKMGDSGFKKVYLIAPRKTLTNIFKIIGNGSSFNVGIEYVEEDSPEGTASALKLLSGKIKTSFLVVFCDTLLNNINLNDLWKEHLRQKWIATAMLCSSALEKNNNTIYGFVQLEGARITSWQEKPSLKEMNSTIFSRGIYVLEPDIFGYKGKNLERDVLPELAKRKLLGGLVSDAEHLHVYNPQDMMKVKKILNKY